MTAQQQDQDQGRSYAYCAWHKGLSDTARLVQAEEAGSSPAAAANLFACAPCREMHHLTPLAEQP